MAIQLHDGTFVVNDEGREHALRIVLIETGRRDPALADRLEDGGIVPPVMRLIEQATESFLGYGDSAVFWKALAEIEVPSELFGRIKVPEGFACCAECCGARRV